MNRKYLEGKFKEIKGYVLESLGKLTRDTELEQLGQAQRVRGKIQSSVENKPS